ncbi:NAD-dependent epimerase/dehydratase family protein [Terrarubrum flagellatum]|uniref:NAD-dependent epimerase/dehydratase family protein n=1 Tax=Terrirubrum flagellatum TaxID=2895980 RepID=UPI0031456A5F
MSANKLALVLGATGGIGGELAQALLRHGWAVRGLRRATSTKPAKSDRIEWVAGDAMNADDVLRAARGASLIAHAVNPPGYRDWDKLVLPMLENTIAAAKRTGARILLPGTIYNYGPDAFPVLRESAPQNPMTVKGRIRVEMEQRLREAQGEGVRSIILRAGDFFGPVPGNNWFSQGLVKPGKPVTSISYPGAAGVGHAWAYLPDVAETMAQLADREETFEPFARFHFAGHWDADGREMIGAIRRVAGDPTLPVKRFPWQLLTLASPFVTLFREMREMRYLWREPLRLDNRRLVAALGAEPHTPLDDAVSATLSGLGCLPPQRRSHERSAAVAG